MKKFTIFLLLLSYFCVVAAQGNSADVIPLPNKIEKYGGNFIFNKNTKWVVENKEQYRLAKQLTDCFLTTACFNYKINVTTAKPKNNVVIFVNNSSLPVEGYQLNVNNQQIRIEASNTKGFFYAIQTIKQLLPSEFNASKISPNQSWSIPALSINDAPRFGYRGFMLDVSRFFMPKDDVLKLIDLLAFHKINYFHWHLVDDNGWRIEIKKYPKLTDVSAWRVDRNNYFSMRSNPEQGEATTSGGYYTQQDIKEVIRYAQERCIEVIPEIEMPAHTISSLAAYPHLACPVASHYIGVLPGIGGQNASDIYCAGNDSVFWFLEDVLREVIDLFPSKYIHIGGDEAVKTNWEKCPRCQLRMKENNIPNEEELQSYFIKRINTFLKKNNKKLMGWDELVDSEIPEGATIFGWRGMGESVEKAGAKGFEYIKSPAKKYYFIRYQGPQWFEPFTYFGNTTLKDVYEYEPMSNQVSSDVTNKMLGVEACLWTEFVNNYQDAEYLIFPRLAAYAESAWTKPENKSWDLFVNRIDKLMETYNFLNVNYARSMFNIEHIVKPQNSNVSIQLSCIRPDVEIRYTSDGSEPTHKSTLYTSELIIKPPITIRACTFKQNERMGAILPLHVINHKAVGAGVIAKDATAYVLTNGIRGTEKKSDGEWLNFYDTDAEFIIKLDSVVNCNTVEVGMLNNSGMSVHLPSEISIFVSVDNTKYEAVYTKQYSDDERFQNGLFRLTKKYDIGNQRFRYLKIIAKKPGNCPPTHVRATQSCHMAFDEILLK